MRLAMIESRTLELVLAAFPDRNYIVLEDNFKIV